MCMLGTICLGFANTITSEDELPILASHAGGGDTRPNVSSSITASINGHLLIINFTENIGEASVEISSTINEIVDFTLIETPTGYQCYIPMTGSYIVTITLANGDEYYGEFEVVD